MWTWRVWLALCRLVLPLALLGIALWLSVRHGDAGDAVIIAVLLGLGVVVYGGIAFFAVKQHRGRGHGG